MTRFIGILPGVRSDKNNIGICANCVSRAQGDVLAQQHGVREADPRKLFEDLVARGLERSERRATRMRRIIERALPSGTVAKGSAGRSWSDL